MTRLGKTLPIQMVETRQLSPTPDPTADPTANERQLFTSFFDREVTGQVKRATLLVGSTAEANDIVQEAFIGIYRRWALIENPGPYLNRSVLNGCRDHARAHSRTLRLLPRLIERGREQPQDSLADVLNQLPFNHRAAIVLKFWGGLSTQQIADELGCSPGSIGPWISRGIKKLRNELS